MSATTQSKTSNSHVIKLRAAWREDVLDCPDDEIVLLRNFGCPTGLEAGQAVFLAGNGLTNSTRFTLNESLLETHAGDVRIRVEELLKPRNVLRIEINLPADVAECKKLATKS